MRGRQRRKGPQTAPRLALLVGGAPASCAPDDREVEARVAAEVATVLAQASDEVLAAAPLLLPLALSVCMQRHDAGADGLIAAMRALRAALLSVSGLDPSDEPVPLVCGEPKVAALALAEYLRGLLARAARACAAEPDVLAHAAAARLA